MKSSQLERPAKNEVGPPPNGAYKTLASLPEKDVILFDSHCRFCSSQIGWIRWLDRQKKIEFTSLHDPSVASRFPDLSFEQLMEQMWLITKDGKRIAGADAVRYLSTRLPLLFPAACLMHIPGTMPLWRFLYRIVARFRYRIAGKSCDEGTCKVHAETWSKMNRS